MHQYGNWNSIETDDGKQRTIRASQCRAFWLAWAFRRPCDFPAWSEERSKIKRRGQSQDQRSVGAESSAEVRELRAEVIRRMERSVKIKDQKGRAGHRNKQIIRENTASTAGVRAIWAKWGEWESVFVVREREWGLIHICETIYSKLKFASQKR